MDHALVFFFEPQSPLSSIFWGIDTVLIKVSDQLTDLLDLFVGPLEGIERWCVVGNRKVDRRARVELIPALSDRRKVNQKNSAW